MSNKKPVDLSALKLKVITESIVLPTTNDPDKEAEELTKSTGLFHRSEYDDMANKTIIINTEVEAQNYDEWFNKVIDARVDEESSVIEPNNFEKNDSYDVTDIDRVAESDAPRYYARYNGNTGWYDILDGQTLKPVKEKISMSVDDAVRQAAEYNREHTLGETESSVKPTWLPSSEGDESVQKHQILPLHYETYDGQLHLYDTSEGHEAEYVGAFDSVEEMDEWISANISEGVLEQYQSKGDGSEGDIEDYLEDYELQSVVQTAIRRFEYAADAADFIYGNYFIMKGTYADWEKIKPQFLDYFEQYGLERVVHESCKMVADSDNYGPAPVEGQNEIEFDKDGNVVLGSSKLAATPGMREGKDHRYDPDADENDYQRTSKMKDRRKEQRAARAKINEELDRDRAFLIAVELTHSGVEMAAKGMMNIDDAVFLMSDAGPTTDIELELGMVGLPLVHAVQLNEGFRVFGLGESLAQTVEALADHGDVSALVGQMGIEAEVFIGFISSANPKEKIDLDAEDALEEDMEEIAAPNFVMEASELSPEALAADPVFIEAVRNAYISKADEVGQTVETFDPDLNQIEDIVEMAIDRYPGGHAHSFMMSDKGAVDTIHDAFNLLWDEGKVGPTITA